MKTKRVLWADGIRIIAIFLIVYVHQLYLLPPLTLNSLWLWTPNLFSLIGIPLFVMLSGALLLGKVEPLKVFFGKRVRAVFIPWIFWVGVYSVLEIFFLGTVITSASEFIRFEYRMFFSRFWFLPMIFGLYFLAPLLRVFLKGADNKLIYYFLAIWFFVLVLLPAGQLLVNPSYSPNTSLFYYILQYSGLFVLGYLLVKREKRRLPNVSWILVLALSLLATYFALYLTALGGNLIRTSFAQIFSPFVLPGIVAAFMLLYQSLAKRTLADRPGINKLVVLASKSALGIYLAHELVQLSLVNMFPQLNSLFLAIPPVPAMFLRAAFIFLASFAIVLALKKIPLLKHIV